MQEGPTGPGGGGPEREGGPDGPSRSAATSRWEQRAGFSVFFDVHTDDEGRETWQTRIYHEEAGDEATVAGTDTARWTTWVLDRLGAPATAPAPEPAAGPRPSGAGQSPAITSARHELVVEILAVRPIGGMPAGGVWPPDAVGVEVELQITGLSRLERALGAAVVEAVLRRRDV